MRISHLWAAPLVLAALIAGCGDADDGGAGGGAGDGGFTADAGRPDAGPDADAGADAGTASFTVTIANFAFSPANLSVPAGATVTVTNLDGESHTVTSESAPGTFTPGAVNGVSFDTGPIPPGGTATFTIPANAPPGTVIPYFCTLHLQTMANTGLITVIGSP